MFFFVFFVIILTWQLQNIWDWHRPVAFHQPAGVTVSWTKNRQSFYFHLETRAKIKSENVTWLFFFFFFLPNRPLRSREILGESISEVSFSHKENILVSSNPSQSPPQSTKGPSSLGHPSGPGWAPWKVPQDWNLPHTHTQIVFSLSPWPLWDPDDLPVDVKVNQSKGRCLGGLHPGGWRSNHRVPHKSHKGNISIPESVRHQ